MSIFASNLAKRVAVAVVAGPLVILLALWSNPIGWKSLTILLTVLGLWEFGSMTFKPHETADRYLLIIIGTILTTVMLYNLKYLLLIFPWATILILTTLVITSKTTDGAGIRLGKIFLGVFYIALLFSFVGLLKVFPYGGKWIIFTLTVVWFSDTGAYFAGKSLGKHKLSPFVSPNKTWEGSIGGIIASIAAAGLATIYFKEASLTVLIGLAIFAGIMGQIGDLAESLIKRSCGVKDSGNLIPGHGGVLDRFDALLFAAPIVCGYLYSRMII